MLKQPVKTTRYSLALLALALGSSAPVEAIAPQKTAKTTAKSKGRHHRRNNKQQTKSYALFYTGVGAAALTALGLTQLFSTTTPSNPTPCGPQFEPQAKPTGPAYYPLMQPPQYYRQTDAKVAPAATQTFSQTQPQPTFHAGKQGGSGNEVTPGAIAPQGNTRHSGANTPTPLSNPAASAPQPQSQTQPLPPAPTASTVSSVEIEPRNQTPQPTPQTPVPLVKEAIPGLFNTQTSEEPSTEGATFVEAAFPAEQIKKEITQLENQIRSLQKVVQFDRERHKQINSLILRNRELKAQLKGLNAQKATPMAITTPARHPQTPACTQATNNYRQRTFQGATPKATKKPEYIEDWEALGRERLTLHRPRFHRRAN